MLSKVISITRLDARSLAMISALALLTMLTNNASADQFVGRHNGREVIVHSNPIPVLLHRLVPPNHGRHLTFKEYQASRHRNPPTTTPPKKASEPSPQDKSKS